MIASTPIYCMRFLCMLKITTIAPLRSHLNAIHVRQSTVLSERMKANTSLTQANKNKTAKFFMVAIQNAQVESHFVVHNLDLDTAIRNEVVAAVIFVLLCRLTNEKEGEKESEVQLKH